MVVTGRHHPPRSGGPAAKRLAAGTRRLVPAALRRDPQDRWAAVFGRIAGYSFARGGGHRDPAAALLPPLDGRPGVSRLIPGA